MKLRKRTPQQLAAMVETSYTSRSRRGATKPRAGISPSEAAAREKYNLEKIVLIDAVIQTVGRVDLFDADSLMALRLTCKGFRDLVDSTGALSVAKFIIGRNKAGCDALETWADGTRLTPRTRSLSIDGEVPVKLGYRVLAALLDQRPPISKLELVDVGVAAESLLTAPLDTLRELRVAKMYRNSAFIDNMMDNTSFNGLQSLSIDRMTSIDARTLAAALAHFRSLRTLHVTDIDIKGNQVDPEVLQNALSCLETLLVNWCSGIEKLGLLSAQGPALPALHNFQLSQGTLSTEFPGLNHLTKLGLSIVHLTGPAIPTALSGGPLMELHLNQGTYPSAYAHWNWISLELPHLTRLELLSYPGNAIMSDVAQARLPALRNVTLPFDHSALEDSAKAFSAAFPGIKELKLSENWNQAQPTAAATLEALGREIVPSLESLDCHLKCHGNNMTTLLHSLLPVGPADGGPCWSHLRSLRLSFRIWQDQSPSERQSAVYRSLARAAPHFPFLTQLAVMFADYTSSESLDVFLTAAKEVEAWPLLQSIRIRGFYQDNSISAQKIHEVWPLATVEPWC